MGSRRLRVLGVWALALIVSLLPAGGGVSGASGSRAADRWPEWTWRARIAGAAFEPGETTAEIAERLDELAGQGVTVVLADSPWGWSYDAWVDDAAFQRTAEVITRMTELAHERGLRVVMYLTGLELIAPPERYPGDEHPDWPQIAITGEPILFDDIGNEDEHWLEEGEWDLWISPCSSYLELSLARVRDVMACGVDGLWVDTVYLQYSIGDHDELWPSFDPCSVQGFEAATGLSVPRREDWDDPAWFRWIVWRHEQLAEFIRALWAAAEERRPGIPFFVENWCVDTSGATVYANDPTVFLDEPAISTGHEIGTIDDRIDLGGTGMRAATLEQWLDFRRMVAFARAADRGKPSWILTYGYQPRDSTLLAGVVLLEGAGFYETRGPGMEESVGAAHRRSLFSWIAAREADWYGGAPLAEVGLLYSPRNRDLVDGGSGDYYDPQDSIHHAAYRAAAQLLYRRHIPFRTVIDTDLERFDELEVLILPELRAMSEATATALRAAHGRLIAIGETGAYDEWMNERSANALEGRERILLDRVDERLFAFADTGLLWVDAPPTLQLSLRRSSGSYALGAVNLGPEPAPGFRLALRLAGDEEIAGARLHRYPGETLELSFSVEENPHRVTVEVPHSIDTMGLIVLERTSGVRVEIAMNGQVFAPGDPLWLEVTASNAAPVSRVVDLFLVLEVAGEYFFHPAWDRSPQAETWTLDPSGEVRRRLLELQLPGSMAGPVSCRFLSAAFTPEDWTLISNVAEWPVEIAVP